MNCNHFCDPWTFLPSAIISCFWLLKATVADLGCLRCRGKKKKNEEEHQQAENHDILPWREGTSQWSLHWKGTLEGTLSCFIGASMWALSLHLFYFIYFFWTWGHQGWAVTWSVGEHILNYACRILIVGGLSSGYWASVLLWEGRWFDSPCLHVKVSLGKILNPKLFLMCWLAPCMAATAISVWMYVWITVALDKSIC